MMGATAKWEPAGNGLPSRYVYPTCPCGADTCPCFAFGRQHAKQEMYRTALQLADMANAIAEALYNVSDWQPRQDDVQGMPWVP